MTEAQFTIGRSSLVDWLVRSAIPTAAIYAGQSEIAVQISSLPEVTVDTLEGRGSRPRPGIVKALAETESHLSSVWCDAHNALSGNGHQHEDLVIGLHHPLRDTLGYRAAWAARTAAWPSRTGFHAYLVFSRLMDICRWSDWPTSATFDKALNTVEIQVLERAKPSPDVVDGVQVRKAIRAEVPAG
ncbi:hypothetical protein [Arthrobacter woluwensis]|uniref:Uncharacterized protein n=1 Tax=Arthrobacter woluwensis TaxID=156980 RepID=A0A1H4I7P7_9MICC|nr:hypothetical protein [Arthrobacter woluwensis]SEB30001.1 hypothetical protein SAMN04489745_0100 [Arthrobacter woluwensis]